MIHFTFVQALVILLLFLVPLIRRIRGRAGLPAIAGLMLLAFYTVLLVKTAFFPLVWDPVFGEAGPLTAAALAFEGFQSRDERNLRANLIYDRFEGLCPLLCCPFRESQYLMLFGSGDEAALSAGL